MDGAQESQKLTNAINKWNKLSIDCVAASSVNIFKNKVDTYLRRAGYIQMNNAGFSISQWIPCTLVIWAFGLDDKSCYIFLNT